MTIGIPDYIKENLKIDILPKSTDSAYLIDGTLHCECKANDFYVFRKMFVDKQSKVAEKELKQKMKKYRAKLKEGNDLCIINRDDKYYLTESNTLLCKEILLEDITSLWNQIGSVQVPPSIVDAVCPHCHKKISVFDSRNHGYMAIVNQYESIKSEDIILSKFKPKVCKCGNDKFNVFLHLSNTGKDDLIKESNGLIREDNWENAFDWISIDLKCTNCGKKTKNWFEMETM